MRGALCVLAILLFLPVPGSAVQGQDTPGKEAEDKAAVAAAQSIQGTTYINRTAHFTMTVPSNWRVTDTLIKTTPNVIGTVTASHAGAIMIQRYDYPLKPPAVAQILQRGFSKGFPGYQLIGESSTTIDGQDADSFSFEFDGPSDSQLHVRQKMLVVLIPNGSSVLGFLCQAPHVGFDTIRKIIDSYHFSLTD